MKINSASWLTNLVFEEAKVYPAIRPKFLVALAVQSNKGTSHKVLTTVANILVILRTTTTFHV